jgi:hypothetical protein
VLLLFEDRIDLAPIKTGNVPFIQGRNIPQPLLEFERQTLGH